MNRGMPRRRITDRQILRLVRKETIAVDGKTVLGKRGLPLRVAHDRCGYPYVVLNHDGRRRAIMLHKLLWMVRHNRTVPKGHELHHTKSKNHPEPEHIALLSQEQHDALDRIKVEEFLNS